MVPNPEEASHGVEQGLHLVHSLLACTMAVGCMTSTLQLVNALSNMGSYYSFDWFTAEGFLLLCHRIEIWTIASSKCRRKRHDRESRSRELEACSSRMLAHLQLDHVF
ncbi:hypothetical protein V6N13_118053 [Hibiscus sabdariffa]|uniref:Uncharacterized protein n=1 Tax=Hibiscus sabdariffa TaxID=183260 RepID=A0ABR2Q8X8_9ROSI